MYISNLQHRYYSIHELTTGAHAKIDLTLTGHKLEWYNMYVRTNSKGIRYNNSVNTEYIGADSYTQDDEVRSLSTTQSIFATNLKGTHHLTEDFTVDWAGVFSQAKEEDPDRTYVTLTNTVSRKAENGGDAVSGSIWDANKNIIKTLPKGAERRFQATSTFLTIPISPTMWRLSGRRVRSIAEKNAAIDIILTSSILPTSRRRWMETD